MDAILAVAESQNEASMPRRDFPPNPGHPWSSSLIDLVLPEVGPPILEPVNPETLADLTRSLDLTTLAGDDHTARVLALAERARRPSPALPPVAAACVYPVFVPTVIDALAGSSVRIATVAAGFPHGLSPLACRITEVRACRKMRVDEIDVVIRRDLALTNDWPALYDEIRAFRDAAGDTVLKVILGTGELATTACIARAALIALAAGADFVKTSTGKEAVNATLEAGCAMVAALTAYQNLTGFTAGLKPAGGVRTVVEALPWLNLARTHNLEPGVRFRIGASALLDDITRRS